MSTAKIITTLDAKIYLELTEGEAGALDAICGYGPKEFREWFYRNMGHSYLKPYEQHLDSLFSKARSLNHAVKELQKARDELKKKFQIV